MGYNLAQTIQTCEKVYMSLELAVTSRGGHSSLPTPDNAIYRLAVGLAQLAGHQFPVRLNDSVRLFMERMARLEQVPALSAAMTRLAAPGPIDQPAADLVAGAAPYYNALLRTTVTATQISGGHAENALPQLARATLNCRLLPEDDPDEVQRTIAAVLADPQIAIRRLAEPLPAPMSPLDPAVLGPVERITNIMWSGVPVLPLLSAGATDGQALRHAGIPVYGVCGMFFDADDNRCHASNERVLVKSYFEGLQFMYMLMRELGSAAPTAK
ncbi:putative peptidase M20 [Paratrimastix pyriformis]|uniref:Peptidase M20 n=1 Tax=Paratrimastix pyriformis TaxID=342808 RepID=A0ABQ8U6D6_9EUKA|nr:putative peptidase M20 [Paratrimastix pyriformis]